MKMIERMFPKTDDAELARLLGELWERLVIALLGLSASILSLSGIAFQLTHGFYLMVLPLVFAFVVGLSATIPWYLKLREVRSHLPMGQ